MSKERLLRSSEVADLFSVDINTIARWMREKKLVPVLRTLGGHARFSQASIDVLKGESAATIGAEVDENEPPAPNQPTISEVIEEYRDVVWRPASNSTMAKRTAPSKTRRIEFESHVDRLNDEHIKSLFGIDRKELHRRIWSTSVNEVALSHNVSPNTLRKFCDAYRIPIPPLPPVSRKRR